MCTKYIDMKSKQCNVCGKYKQLIEFTKDKRAKEGRTNRCKDCTNKYIKNRKSCDYRTNTEKAKSAIKKKYGLTPKLYDEIMNQAGDTCPLCKNKYTKSARHKKVIEHCHDSGRIRGVCCARCNTAMGMAGDNAETLRRLYLWVS